MRMILLLLISMTGMAMALGNPNEQSFNETLQKDELKFIKENYQWDTRFIIVNFTHPNSSCHYDNYGNLKKSSIWWKEFYSKLVFNDLLNIFVYSEEVRAKKIIDSKTHFMDKDDFFLKTFFSKEKTCQGILIINENGRYQQKNGEYTQEDIVELIKNLE